MFGSLFFIFWRIVEITFLIPIIGMLVRTATCDIRNSRYIRLLTTANSAGLLRRRLRQEQPADPVLHPRSFHRQRHRRLLGPRHADPPLDHQALRGLRRLRRRLLLRRLRRRRLPAALHRQPELRALGRRRRLRLAGALWLLWRAYRQPAVVRPRQDVRHAQDVLRARHHGDRLLLLDRRLRALHAPPRPRGRRSRDQGDDDDRAPQEPQQQAGALAAPELVGPAAAVCGVGRLADFFGIKQKCGKKMTDRLLIFFFFTISHCDLGASRLKEISIS